MRRNLIYADSNEPADTINAITSAGIAVEILQLRPAADYIIGGNLLTKQEIRNDIIKILYSRLSLCNLCDMKCAHTIQRSVNSVEENLFLKQVLRNIAQKSVLENQLLMQLSKLEEEKSGCKSEEIGIMNGLNITRIKDGFTQELKDLSIKQNLLNPEIGNPIKKKEINNNLNTKINDLMNSSLLKEANVRFADLMIYDVSKFIIWMRLRKVLYKEEDVEVLYGMISSQKGIGIDCNSFVQTVIELLTILESDANRYTYGGLAIESKSSQDFYSSIYSNRLFKQLHELHSMEQYKPVLCVHGPIPVPSKWIRGPTGKPMQTKTSEEETKKKTKTAIATFSTALKSFPRLSVLMFKNKEQFIMFIVDYYFRMTKETEKPVIKQRVETLEDVKFGIFSQFPGVGSKGSKAMVDSKITIAELCSLTAEEIKNKFEGIGNKRAESIVEILHK